MTTGHREDFRLSERTAAQVRIDKLPSLLFYELAGERVASPIALEPRYDPFSGDIAFMESRMCFLHFRVSRSYPGASDRRFGPSAPRHMRKQKLGNWVDGKAL